ELLPAARPGRLRLSGLVCVGHDVSSLREETEQCPGHTGRKRRKEWFRLLRRGRDRRDAGRAPHPRTGPASPRALNQTRAPRGRPWKCSRTRSSSERKWRSGRFLKRRRHVEPVLAQADENRRVAGGIDLRLARRGEPQVLWYQDRSIGERDRLAETVLELADVAGPVVPLERAQRRLRERRTSARLGA